MNAVKKIVAKKILQHRFKGVQKKVKRYSGNIKKKLGNAIYLEKVSARSSY